MPSNKCADITRYRHTYIVLDIALFLKSRNVICIASLNFLLDNRPEKMKVCDFNCDDVNCI